MIQIDAQTIELVVQVITTAGLSIAGIRGMIAALTARVATIETDVADLRRRYATMHPQTDTKPEA